MASGFLAGILWGGVVGTGLLLVSSQTMDRQQLSFPKPEASAVDVPGGSEFDQARVDTEPVLPGTEATPGADEIVTGVLPPEDAVETPPALDTASLKAPEPSTESPAGLSDAPEAADAVTLPGNDAAGSSGSSSGAPALEAPVTPLPAPAADTAAPVVGDAPATEGLEVVETGAGDAATAGTEIAALPAETVEMPPAMTETAPEVRSESDVPASPAAPEIGEAPSMPGVQVPEAEGAPTTAVAAVQPEVVEPEAPAVSGVPAPEPEAAPVVAPVPDSGGVTTVDGSGSQFFTPVETIENRAEGVDVNRLPTIGGDEGSVPVVRRLPGTPIAEGDTGAAEDDLAEAPDVSGGPAIRAHAMEFAAPAGGALISVILLHDGAEAMAAADLALVPSGVVFAVDAAAPNATRIAADYRSAGREVVLIPALPQGASPQDVEVALAANLADVPEAVALMDVSGSSFQSDREAVAQVVQVIAATGHGLVTFPRGLNTAHQQAERAGLPTGLIFRILDEDGETEEQIRRTLDRAAFRARQDTPVILVGHAQPGTIAAVSGWAETGGDVTLAPVSAALGG